MNPSEENADLRYEVRRLRHARELDRQLILDLREKLARAEDQRDAVESHSAVRFAKGWEFDRMHR